MTEVRKVLFQIVWMARDRAIPDSQLRARIETLADATVHQIDDAASFRRDVVEVKRQPDGDVIEA